MGNITAKEYMANSGKLHNEYWGQFVNESIIRYVKSGIGEDKIARSTDKHFNDIPLKEWDALYQIKSMINVRFFKEMHNTTYREEDRDKFLWSLSNQVCIAKAAARQIKNTKVMVQNNA